MSRFMEKKILTVLLDSYERSRLFREGGSARRIQFRPMEREDFAELAEKSDARREFLDTAEELAAEGLIEYDWVRYEEGNLIDRIFLRTEEAAVRRVRKQAQLDVLESQVQAALFRIEAAFQKIERKGDEKITAWLRAALEEIRCKRRIPRLFFKGEKDPESEKTAARASEQGPVRSAQDRGGWLCGGTERGGASWPVRNRPLAGDPGIYRAGRGYAGRRGRES